MMKDTQKIRRIFPKNTQFEKFEDQKNRRKKFLNLYSCMSNAQGYPEKMIENKGDI